LLCALRAIIIQHLDAGGLAGAQCERRDLPDLEPADILLAAHERPVERWNVFAAVAGNRGSHKMERQNVGLVKWRRPEVLGVYGGSDGIYVAAHRAAGKIE